MNRFALLLVLLLPAACAAPGTPGPTPVQAVVTVTEPEPQAVTVAEPEKEQAAPAPAPPDIDLLPPARAGLPTANSLQPERLIGLLDSELERVLGIPDFRRKDPPAQIWQYRNQSCLFDVFLFQDKARSNAYAVTYIEARGLDVNRVSDRDCFLSVLKERKQG